MHAKSAVYVQLIQSPKPMDGQCVFGLGVSDVNAIFAQLVIQGAHEKLTLSFPYSNISTKGNMMMHLKPMFAG